MKIIILTFCLVVLAMIIAAAIVLKSINLVMKWKAQAKQDEIPEGLNINPLAPAINAVKTAAQRKAEDNEDKEIKTILDEYMGPDDITQFFKEGES